MTRQLKPCGTPAAYKRHKRRGEPIDDACRTAYNRYVLNRQIAYQRARQRAYTALTHAQPQAWKALFDLELRKVDARASGADRRRARNRARQKAFTRLARCFPDVYADLLAKERANDVKRGAK